MTYQDEVKVGRPSVGTKVLLVGIAVLAVLGSFWSIVWFIRSYVEAPRVNIAPMALAARESTPVVPAAPTVRPAPIGAAAPQPAAAQAAAPAPNTAEAAPAAPPAEPPASSAIADRWLPMTPAAPRALDPAPAPAPEVTAPAALATAAPDNDPPVEEVAEGSVPAIEGPAPLPRRKPTLTAAVRSRIDPPLPRPRPDGPAPQSVWTAVPTTDDRFPQQ